MTRRGPLRLVVLAVVAALLSGCSYNAVQEVPLPGGASLGDEPYTVTVMFENVVDLVANNSVRVNDVPVGVVRSVALAPDGWTAEAILEVNGAVMLPANAVARLRQTSLLGEKFVELIPASDQPAQGRLANNAVIGLDRTDIGAQVEEVLGALSLLLNGGGVEKIQTIAREVNDISTGNEPQLRALIDNLNVFVGTLDRQSDDIVRAIDSLDRLTRTLVDQRARLANVIDNLAPGLDVLNQQRGNLVAMLQALEQLGVVGTDVINRSRDNTVADLRALQPILGKLVESGDDFPGSLQILVTIPFNDKSLQALKGDFANITITLDLNLQDLLNNLVSGAALPDVNDIFSKLTPQPLNGLELPVPGTETLPQTPLRTLLTQGQGVPQPGTATVLPGSGSPQAQPQPQTQPTRPQTQPTRPQTQPTRPQTQPQAPVSSANRAPLLPLVGGN